MSGAELWHALFLRCLGGVVIGDTLDEAPTDVLRAVGRCHGARDAVRQRKNVAPPRILVPHAHWYPPARSNLLARIAVVADGSGEWLPGSFAGIKQH